MRRGDRVLPDTNVILRYLLHDDHFIEAETFFEQVRVGAEKALILECVVVECLYVLTKFYKVPKMKAAEALTGLLQYKGVVNKDKKNLVEGLALFAKETLDPVDCFLVAKAKEEGLKVMTFDKALKRLVSKSTS